VTSGFPADTVWLSVTFGRTELDRGLIGKQADLIFLGLGDNADPQIRTPHQFSVLYEFNHQRQVQRRELLS